MHVKGVQHQFHKEILQAAKGVAGYLNFIILDILLPLSLTQAALHKDFVVYFKGTGLTIKVLQLNNFKIL